MTDFECVQLPAFSEHLIVIRVIVILQGVHIDDLELGTVHKCLYETLHTAREGKGKTGQGSTTEADNVHRAIRSISLKRG